jgi:hypothetical protein
MAKTHTAIAVRSGIKMRSTTSGFASFSIVAVCSKCPTRCVGFAQVGHGIPLLQQLIPGADGLCLGYPWDNHKITHDSLSCVILGYLSAGYPRLAASVPLS